jgi:outer membrane cobalamin receptor
VQNIERNAARLTPDSVRLPVAVRLCCAVLLMAGSAGCSFATDEGGGRPGERVITAEEIERTGADNAWDALRRVGTNLSMSETATGRARSVRRRGATSINLSNDVTLMLDGMRTDAASLQRVQVPMIREIRILSGPEATRRFGTGHGHGAVLVITR